MLFRHIVYAALCVGLLAGVILTLVQQYQVAPLIMVAEQYEQPAHQHHSSAHGHQHQHSHQAWSPANGNERLRFSLLSNVLAGVGMALMLLALMTYLQLRGKTQLSWASGFVWGLAGFATFFVAPALGMPPEIPGIEAAPITNRQLWWLMTVLSTAAGIALLSQTGFWKVLAVVLFFLPHLINAPAVQGPEFLQSDPAIVETLNQLHIQFIVASTLCNFLFWMALGTASAATAQHWVLKRYWVQKHAVT